MSEYVDDANRHLDDNLKCVICGMQPVRVYWSDMPGEAMCKHCGVPYMVIMRTEYGMRINGNPVLNLNPAWANMAQEYWNEQKQFMGLGTVINTQQYPECLEGRSKFYEWARNKYGSLPR